jgi:hypothetical protein
VLPEIAGAEVVAVTISQNNSPVAFDLGLSATDADEDPLTWSISTAATNGAATVVAPGTGGSVLLSYVPDLDYLGVDTFVVEVSDGQGGTDTVTVNVTVEEPPNVLPEIAGAAVVAVTISQNNSPVAFDLGLSATDADEDPLTWSISTAATNGAATVVAPGTGGSVLLSYVPVANYTGVDSFVVEVSDGQGGTDTVTVNVTIEAAPAYDAWTFDQFSPLSLETEATIWGESADPDQDGYSNLEEFALGLDPMASDGAPNLISISRDPPGSGGQLLLSYKVRMDGAVTALDYTMEVSTELSSEWAELAEEDYVFVGESDLGGGFRLRTIRLNGVVPAARFFRLRFAR